MLSATGLTILSGLLHIFLISTDTKGHIINIFPFSFAWHQRHPDTLWEHKTKWSV